MCVLPVFDVLHAAHKGIFNDFFHLRSNFIHEYITSLFFLQIVRKLFLEKHIAFNMRVAEIFVVRSDRIIC